MKLESYQAELKTLKENAREFARKYPALAPHLASSSNDPDVERILQGTAYLSAGIRDRLETDFPEFAQSILRLVAPDYLKEIPATTIVEFKPRNILNNPVTVKKGAKVDSQKVGGISCRFHACSDVTVYPLTINACDLNQIGQESELDIAINNTSLANAEVELEDLSFHLAGEYVDASQLYFLLTRKLKSISIVKGSDEEVLKEVKIQPQGWEKDFELLSNSKTTFSSYRRLQEYFINKHKFLFLKLTGLKSAGNLPRAFKLRFRFESNSFNTQVDRNSFKLFCAPVINLFESDAEPISLSYKTSELPLSPIRNTHNQFTVHSVNSVVGQSRRSATKHEYQEFSIAAKEQGEQAVFELMQRYSDDLEAESYLRLSFPKGKELPEMEVLTTKLMCTNGRLARELKLGDVNVNTSDIPDVVSVGNVTSVSDYIPPVTDGGVLWKLLAHLTANYLPLADLDNFKALLQLYNPVSKFNAKEHTANQKRIDSIRNLKTLNADRLYRGTMVRGKQIKVDVDGSGFSSLGDLYLFGELLNFVFQQFADVNSFVELKLNDLSTGEQLTWQPNLASR